MTRDEIIDDLIRRCIDDKDFTTDPVRVLAQVGLDMKRITIEGSFVDKLKAQLAVKENERE